MKRGVASSHAHTNPDTSAPGGGVTESKEMLFGVGWHDAERGSPGGIGRVGTMRSTAALSRNTGSSGHGQRRVYYENKQGQYLSRGEFLRQQEEDKKREHLLRDSTSAIRGLLSVMDDDAKQYDAFVGYFTQKSRHLSRLLAGLCTGVSIVLVMLFMQSFTPDDAAFSQRLEEVVTAPPPPPDSGLIATNASTTVYASPFVATCQLEVGKCMALYTYARLYDPLGYFFLVASMAGAILGLIPFAHEASLVAPHRAAQKRVSLLERAANDPAADPRARAKANEELGRAGPPESHVVALLRHFFNPAFVASLASWACTIAVMSVEHDRRRKGELIAIDSELYSRLTVAILARAVANVLGLLVALGTSSDPGAREY